MANKLLPTAVMALSLAATCGFTLLSEHSFKGPFSSFNNEGNRVIDGWKYGGSTSIYENYLRLTPDRQSKRGHVWNSNKVQTDSWSATIKFRISGQGKKLFGDGLAFWFTTQSFYRDGELHGFTDMFTGFGIVFDTYVNKEPGHVHKDILFLGSDGTTSKKAAGEHGGGTDANPIGCDSDFRFWEGRQDFSVANRSAVRITFKDDKVSVYIDARGNNDWKTCFQNAVIPAAAGWWRNGAYMGLTSSTGDLADNHDVLSVQVGLEDEVAPDDEEMPVAMISTGRQDLDVAIQSATSREAQKLGDKLTLLQHQMEHQLASVNDNIKAAIKKIQDQETDNKKRIDELEKKFSTIVGDTVETTMRSRIDKMESAVSGLINRKLATDVLPSMQSQLESSGKAWFWPFVILLVILLPAGGYLYSRIRYLSKRDHIL